MKTGFWRRFQQALAGRVADYGARASALQRGDVLIAISQEPYSRSTVEAVAATSQRGVTVVALTDRALSPLARNASHFLLFCADSISFFTR